MLLVIDIGNTTVTLGAYQGDSLKFVSRFATELQMTSDQCFIRLSEIFKVYNINASNFIGAIISSVVPAVLLPMKRAIKRIINICPVIVSNKLNTGINFNKVEKDVLGSDLIAGCTGAVSLCPTPCIVVDLGTATTICVVDKDKNFLGGMIIPGVKTSLDALTNRTSLLPDISLEKPSKLICTDTVESIRSGVIYGTAAMIDGLCRKIEEKLGYECNIVATGGWSRDVVSYCEGNIILIDDLLLYGLKEIYKLND